ncbi:DUF6903 family protein [Streptobacillus moniliformis]|uniref:DUF6903 family protein n=1 Tax=Streptobacillus moniliformis TaxID=34105 RepID=UPI000A5612D7|nr:hypothetical protein [Streptobacillus moniliformis]
MNKYLKILLYLMTFFLFLKLIIDGQKRVSLENLGVMLIGLFGLITLLYLYNKNEK